ncbi:class I SAM-dependent methyltransferase [Ponticoccus sp. SC2-23]|uniref:class I SAM-dependent methyltransferase n=1 Tax=Alexandriicola marinus TaxID=2081710 RepID=UPI000FDC0F39|nr:class I SAM-dependent methyltransferase [Alexandriicola marinus]MBM1219658.1 class I SAM-dependent methyltransferase [Ponticoccus sp. SC6-9]MBM1223270.1 class I SAM-dependent methyltransferase [Ponticoccus sp. SC6-15]MBM1229471.1 class I SAM-dependent methyltransferase [Ponticoccus sp. SC6-38]MBM1232236.1 class I SAM-dependent methyltransferase [Ponticoccus sp. SC6-45]MBM1237814.1 class I SAM-dependent methyltransferase [Ponticoccus sp. SC6-49]MBM1241247.1 class I SAM-dependent methyltrans
MSQAAIWDRFAKGYAKRAISDPESYNRKLEQTAQRLTPSSRLLEIACGTGTTALWHAPNVAHVRASDFSSQMIAIARQKAEDAGVTNVEFVVEAIDDLPRPEAPFDVALAMSILHLLPDPTATLRRVTDCLRPGGYVFSSTVCLRDMGGLVPRLIPYLSWTRLLPRLNPMSADQVIAAHEAAGLRILDRWSAGPGSALFIEAQTPE